MAAQDALGWFLHVGVKVNRVNDLNRIFIVVCQLAQGGKNDFKRFTEILSAVGCDENDALAFGSRDQVRYLWWAWQLRDLVEGVYNSIACDEDLVRGDIFAKQVIF